MRAGLRHFFSGGAADLDGETLMNVRAAADQALLAGRHIPQAGGPVAPAGWLWVELEGAFDEGPGVYVEDLLEEAGAPNWPENERLLGMADEWGLTGPVRDLYVWIDQNPMNMLGAGTYYQAWYLVPRGPNFDRRGGWVG